MKAKSPLIKSNVSSYQLYLFSAHGDRPISIGTIAVDGRPNKLVRCCEVSMTSPAGETKYVKDAKVYGKAENYFRPICLGVGVRA